MNTANNSFGLRIVIASFIVSVFMIGVVTYRTYSEDVKEGISEKMVELLPDLENGLAQL